MAKRPALALVSTGGGPRQTLSPTKLDLPADLRAAINAFEQQIGGRAALIEALSVGDTDPFVQQVLCAIADADYQHPTNPTKTLAAICAEAGISPGQLFHAFQTAALKRGQVLASLAAAQAAPLVVAELVKQALPHEETCPRCDGLTTIVPRATKKVPNPEPIPCPACKATGVLKVEGKYDQQLTALEVAGVLTKGGGLHLAVQQTTTTIAGGTGGSGFGLGSLEQLQQAVGEVLYARKAASTTSPTGPPVSPPIDVTPTDAGGPP